MSDETSRIDRRAFLKTATGLGIASVIGATSKAFGTDANTPKPADANSQGKRRFEQVPRRKLGKTNVMVPILNLGGIFDTVENQLILRRAIDWGITYWDTAWGYNNGNSEIGMGNFIGKNPKLRKELFVVTKTTGARDIADMKAKLDESLKRLQTDYVDLLFWHGLDNPDILTDEVKNFAAQAKKEGKIKFYGFSTHSNMAKTMAAASKLDWIDVIMTKYSFREMQDKEMQDAVDACYKSGIGLVAMKTQAKGPTPEDPNNPLGQFMEKGFTKEQACLKAIWQDERIASICSAMTNIAILTANVSAALDKTRLTEADMEIFRQYAQASCSGYCAGCTEICRAAMPEIPVGDIMRYVMYHDSYGSKALAKQEFATIDAAVRERLANIDFGAVEMVCPNRLPIGQLIRDAAVKLA